jgi:hypothetical protein
MRTLSLLFTATVVASAVAPLGCGADSPGAGGASHGTTHAGAGGAGGAPDTDGGAPAGPVAYVRLSNYLRPTFLQLDLCLRGQDGVWVGPLLRGQRDRADAIVDSVRYGKVGPYAAVAPGTYTARLVEEGNADCLTQIAGLPDVPLSAPLVKDTFSTLWATGWALADAQPFHLGATADRAPEDGKLLVRVFQLDADYGAMDIWGQNEHDPPYELYDDLALDDLSAPYREFDSSKGQPFYKDFDARPHGGATPVLSRSFNTLVQGSWTFTIRYATGVGDPPVDFSMCQDGVLGARLCYPCGLPDCTNH